MMLVGAIRARIFEELILTTLAHRDLDLNQGPHGCESTKLSRYLQVISPLFPI